MLESFEERDGGVVGEVLVVVVVDLNHGRVGACAEAFDFGEGEEAILCGFAWVDAQVVLDGFHDGVAVAEHAGGLFIGVSHQLSLLYTPHDSQ